VDGNGPGKALRILILTDRFLPAQGGVERHTYTLARYLSTLSHEVHVVTSPSPRPELDSLLDSDLKKKHGIEISRRLPKATSLSFYSTANYVYNCRIVLKYINEHSQNYDIVHYHGTRQLLLRLVRSETPTVTSVHGIFPACLLQSPKPCQNRSIAKCAICDMSQEPEHAPLLPIAIPYYFFYYKLMKASLSYIDRVICVSEHVRKCMKEYLNLDNLVTIHNFIDSAEVIAQEPTSSAPFDVREHFDLPSDSKIVAYFGALSFNKGVDLLIEAFKRLREKVGNNVYLVIGGDGHQKMQLGIMAKQAGNIIFTGFLPRKAQLAAMKQSDVFVHLPRYPDACPTTILEAMTLGVPVIASRVGGIPELIIDGKGGYVVTPSDAQDASEAIFRLLSNADLRRQFSLFNKKRSSVFDIKHVGPRITQLYQGVLR